MLTLRKVFSSNLHLLFTTPNLSIWPRITPQSHPSPSLWCLSYQSSWLSVFYSLDKTPAIFISATICDMAIIFHFNLFLSILVLSNNILLTFMYVVCGFRTILVVSLHVSDPDTTVGRMQRITFFLPNFFCIIAYSLVFQIHSILILFYYHPDFWN